MGAQARLADIFPTCLADDIVYEQAVNVARRYQIPLVHISANSGARVGLDEAVKACFRVEWEDPADYGRGVKYFYLTHEDYVRVCRTQKVVATKLTMPDGACRWRLDDAVGGIGHECLQVYPPPQPALMLMKCKCVGNELRDTSSACECLYGTPDTYAMVVASLRSTETSVHWFLDRKYPGSPRTIRTPQQTILQIVVIVVFASIC